MSKQSHSYDLIEKKIGKEYPFFESIGATLGLDEKSNKIFLEHCNEAYIHLNKMLIESDIQPIVAPLKLRGTKILTENETIDEFFNHISRPINESFVAVINKGNTTEHHDEARKVTSEMLKNGLELPPQLIYTYYILEKILFERIKDIFLPKDSALDIANFTKELPKDYYELFDETIDTQKDKFNNSITNIIKSLGPKLFLKSVELSEDTDVETINKGIDKIKGIATYLKDDIDLSINDVKNPSKTTTVEDIL